MELKETILTSEVTNRIVTVEDLLKVHDLSLDEWEITKKVVNSWESSSKNKDGEVVNTPNFQVKVWLQNKKTLYDLQLIREEFKKDIQELSPKVEKYKYNILKDLPGRLLEINIFDLHLGKVAWSEEIGQEYNLEIASTVFLQAIRYFIQKSKNENIEKILLPVGNDFFNSDYAHPYSRTTKGTPQEEDVRWQKTFRTGRNLIVQAATELSQLAPVDIIMIPGNHDFERTFYLGDSLEAWFHNNENILVDNSPTPRKYYPYGKVLLGFTHGSEENIKDLPGIMAQEVPDLWGRTVYREFHLGHLHHKKSRAFLPTTEVQGTLVRHMSSLSGTDAWHHRKGYVGARRSAEAMIWDKELGLESNLYFNLPKKY